MASEFLTWQALPVPHSTTLTTESEALGDVAELTTSQILVEKYECRSGLPVPFMPPFAVELPS